MASFHRRCWSLFTLFVKNSSIHPPYH
ncbi:unnamed protein product [Spirodela intermedia]|uniref:Uncharacterized protein n=1 Tax=Spirodela intermedia TaxID=51605 RepID=A0A7I8K2L5_SPIIN|nr:unnamed protein product [Spirodela intermedia]